MADSETKDRFKALEMAISALIAMIHLETKPAKINVVLAAIVGVPRSTTENWVRKWRPYGAELVEEAQASGRLDAEGNAIGANKAPNKSRSKPDTVADKPRSATSLSPEPASDSSDFRPEPNVYYGKALSAYAPKHGIREKHFIDAEPVLTRNVTGKRGERAADEPLHGVKHGRVTKNSSRKAKGHKGSKH